jgi:hypothetical protein
LGGDYFLSYAEPVEIPQGKLSVYVDGSGEDHEFIMRKTNRDLSNVGRSSDTVEVEPIPYSSLT